MNMERIDPPAAPRPAGGYTQAALVTGAERWLLVSGQVPGTRDGHVPGTFEEQARVVWANVLAALEAAGMTVGNLVKVTTFVRDREDLPANSRIRREVLGAHTPALTVVLAGLFDEGALLEVEAVAAA